METPETTTLRKSVLPYVLGATLILLLGAAAFIAVRYFNQRDGQPAAGPGQNVISIQGSDGAPRTFALRIKPASELPAAEPDVIGVFAGRQDNSIFVGTGNIEFIVEAEPGQAPQADSSFSGPKVEVVISPGSIIYKDITALDASSPDAEMQQVVEPSTIDEITEQSSISVWGRKRGDRVIADVVVFSTPYLLRAPGAP